MNPRPDRRYIAFEGDRRIASGDLARGRPRGQSKRSTGASDASILVFDGRTSGTGRSRFSRHRSTTCWRGCRDVRPADADDDAAPPAPRGPGRPKLGVVAREITLLPRHWEWLAQQPGGASVAIRKLVEEARRDRRGQGSHPRRRRKRPIASCRRWPATGRITKTRSARCSRTIRPRFEKLIAGLARRRPRPRRDARGTGISPRAAARAPVDPADVNR